MGGISIPPFFIIREYHLKFLISIILFHFSFFLNAQNLTGIWKGQFIIDDKKSLKSDNEYKFELQILQNVDGSLRGVTYTYKVKEYYGKADFTGQISKNLTSVLIKESKITEVEKNDKTEVCLMLCNLKYSKNSKGEELLTGSFTSNKPLSNQFCFAGNISVKKVVASTFPIESYLKKAINKIKLEVPKKIESSNKAAINKDTILSLKNVDSLSKIALVAIQNEELFESIKPEVLTKRENKIIATVRVSSKNIKILFFDNGIIDNDTISVFLNSQIIINKKRVSTNPISFDVKFSDSFKKNEIIATADNLGDIPPNTALMIIEVDKKRIEIPIMADFKVNAKVIIEYEINSKLTIQRF